MSIVSIIINGVVGCLANDTNLDIDNSTVKEIAPNVYVFESKDIMYKWRQRQPGGIVELVDQNIGTHFEYNNGLRAMAYNYIEDGDFVNQTYKPLKVITYQSQYISNETTRNKQLEQKNNEKNIPPAPPYKPDQKPMPKDTSHMDEHQKELHKHLDPNKSAKEILEEIKKKKSRENLKDNENI